MPRSPLPLAQPAFDPNTVVDRSLVQACEALTATWLTGNPATAGAGCTAGMHTWSAVGCAVG